MDAVPVEDVGAMHRGRDVMEAAGARLDGGKAEGDEPHRNGEEAQGKGKAGKPIAIAALRQRGTLGRGRSGADMGFASQSLDLLLGR